jgi:hypothetical protein
MRAPAEPERAEDRHAAADKNREQEEDLGCRHGRRVRSACRTARCMAPLMIQHTPS